MAGASAAMEQETPTTRYTKRDLRAADLLGLILCGTGAVVLLVTLAAAVADGRGPWRPAPWAFGVTFVLLGAALNLKVRELVRNGGREARDSPGVPE